MAKFLKIQNYGIADLQAFIVLGMSSARGEDGKIGQFGSGSKHGVLTLMRAGLDPTIYLGKHKLSFFTKTENFQGKKFERVGYSFDGKQEMLSFCLDFGGLDWQHIHMGLREFISNAIDAVGTSKVKVELVDAEEPTPHYTTVYIPATPEVVQYYRGLSTYFLQFAGTETQKIIKKDAISPCKVYRKGVFIRTLQTNSVYDYNFGAEVEIDESRNMDEWNASYNAQTYFNRFASPEEVLDLVFENVDQNVLEISKHYSSYSGDTKKLKELFIQRYGDKTVIGSPMMREAADFAMSKGFNVKYVMSDKWYQELSKFLPNTLNFSSEMENGFNIVEPTQTAINCRDKVWKLLEQLEATKNKKIPPVKCFRSIMSGKANVGGFYKDGTVYMNLEYENSIKIMLEELSHYITDAADMTRDFQDYAFNVASRMSEYLI